MRFARVRGRELLTALSRITRKLPGRKICNGRYKRCRGCLTVPASELDLAWSGYVETVERLVIAVDGRVDPLGMNIEKAIRQLVGRISDAIMYAMETGPVLDEKVSLAT